MTWEIRQGRNLDLLAAMPDESVQTCITSPPYWGLRDYGEADQLGLEPTPEEYVENMVAVFREVRRVLRDDGSLWLNLGDCFGPHKQLVGIPWRVAFALQADGWYLRSDIIWHKPNPMPESVTDRPTKAHEYIFLLTKEPRYYYDADAIREEAAVDTTGQTIRFSGSKYGDSDDPHHATKSGNAYEFTGGRNKRTVWTVSTKPFSGAHFAVFPPDLIEPCVLAGASPTACGECGAPYERIVERIIPTDPGRGESKLRDADGLSARAASTAKRQLGGNYQKQLNENPPRTVGWQPSCDHSDDSAKSVILDPFSGSGTTGIVALRHDRSYIGLELNPEYAEMSRNRIRDDAPLLNTGQEVAA